MYQFVVVFKKQFFWWGSALVDGKFNWRILEEKTFLVVVSNHVTLILKKKCTTSSMKCLRTYSDDIFHCHLTSKLILQVNKSMRNLFGKATYDLFDAIRVLIAFLSSIQLFFKQKIIKSLWVDSKNWNFTIHNNI